MTEHISITVPIPASKKNRRRIVTTRGKIRSIPSEQAVTSEKQIREAWIEKVGKLQPQWGDEEIALVVIYDVASATVEIQVGPCGEKPKGVTGRRRDVQGFLETICDALEGLAYKNDNQVSMVVMRRVV